MRAGMLLVAVSLMLVACGESDGQLQPGADEPQDGPTVLRHELTEHALWASDADTLEEAAEEFLEQALGWSADPMVHEELARQQPEELTDREGPEYVPPIPVVAQGPDGQPLALRLAQGEPRWSFLGEPDEPSPDNRWRVHSVVTHLGYRLTLDEEVTELRVHQVPDEQHRSLVLMYAGDESSTHLLDEGELEPGAEVEAVELSVLGLEDPDRAVVVLENAEFVALTVLMVHLDEQDRVVGAVGATVTEDLHPR